jgi:soluble lytic murein transglycosylase
LLALLAAAAACNGGDADPRTAPPPDTPHDTATPAHTPAPTPTPTPRPSPTEAARLDRAGEYDAAAAAYAAIASSASGATRQQARIDQARALIRADKRAEARPVLEAYLADAGASGDSSPARYMLATILDGDGDVAGALASYERYIAAAGPLTPFARAERAALLARASRAAEAETEAATLLAGVLPREFHASFALALARAFEDGGANEDALVWYARVRDLDGDVATALLRTGAVHKRLGDPAWTSDVIAFVTAYPAHGAAPELLDELDAASVPVSDYVRGVVDYRARRNDAAREALTRAVAAGDHPAEATYYLAALDERAGDEPAAIDRYQQAHDLEPASPLADDALWWRGRLLEKAARFDEARRDYQALAAAYPTASRAGDAAFRVGLMLERAGDRAGAAAAWGALATAPATSAEDRFRARFWRGRALLALGDPAGPTALQELASDPAADGDFYALRASVLLATNAAVAEPTATPPPPTDWDALGRELQLLYPASPPLDTRGSPSSREQLADALEDAAEHDRAQALLAAEMNALAEAHDVVGLAAFARRREAAGDVSIMARAATKIRRALPTDTAAPAEVLRLAYPLAYAEIATGAARDEGISPLLLLALVRQESFYDAGAGSTAGALGLTQVIPPTGESIADRLGVAGFAPEDLFRPSVSLRFGAHYLAAQLADFAGDPYRALAAYNGGPGAASDAAALSGDDDDLFVESLEFDETRLYVRLVMENYARYRQLYGGSTRPSLPR